MHLINKKVYCEDQRGSLGWIYRLGQEGLYKEGWILFQRHIDKYDPDNLKQRIILWINMNTIVCEPCRREKR